MNGQKAPTNVLRCDYEGTYSRQRRLRAVMLLRRAFLVLAAPLVLFLTIWSVLQWRQWLLWLFP